MTDGFGNGNPPRRYEVGTTEGYRLCREEIETNYPRVVQERLFPMIELLLGLFHPDAWGRSIGSKGWQLTTREGFCIPEIYIFFRFEDGRITLELAAPDE